MTRISTRKYNAKKMEKRMKKGFTLIELLMVIALIAIVSTLAVTKVGGIREASARKVSLANQKAVERGVESYISFNHRGIDRLDSLVDDEVPLQTGANGFFDMTSSTMSKTGAGFYLGPDDGKLGAYDAETVRERNAGITPNLANSALLPYSLSEAEAYAMNNWGYKYLMRHTTYADSSPRTEYVTGDDGAYLPDDASLGLDPNRSACIPRAITNGMVVAAISPFSQTGREIYRDCGQLLLDKIDTQGMTPQQYTQAYRAQSGTVLAELSATGGPLLAFGLGENASIVGSADAGLESAPYATYPNRKFYSRYLLLFRVDTSSRAGKVTFAGVIDPCASTVRTAQKAIQEL